MSDGTVTIIARDGAPLPPVVRHHHPFDVGSFFAGLIVAVLVMWLIRKRSERLVRLREADRTSNAFNQDYADLAKRTATLEKIVTEPAARLTQEIDALR